MLDVKFHEWKGGLCSQISPFVKYTYVHSYWFMLSFSKIIKNADIRPLSGCKMKICLQKLKQIPPPLPPPPASFRKILGASSFTNIFLVEYTNIYGIPSSNHIICRWTFSVHNILIFQPNLGGGLIGIFPDKDICRQIPPPLALVNLNA